MYYNIVNTKENIEYFQIISELLKNPNIAEMKNFRQHYNTSCFRHCLEVSYISYLICKKLNLDYVSAARAGLLHDLFLYDWRLPHKNLPVKGKHAFAHPKIALMNSSKLCELNDKEKDMIVKHMWPVTFFAFPKYKETFIITLVDKYSAIKSCIEYYDAIFFPEIKAIKQRFKLMHNNQKVSTYLFSNDEEHSRFDKTSKIL